MFLFVSTRPCGVGVFCYNDNHWSAEQSFSAFNMRHIYAALGKSKTSSIRFKGDCVICKRRFFSMIEMMKWSWFLYFTEIGSFFTLMNHREVGRNWGLHKYAQGYTKKDIKDIAVTKRNPFLGVRRSAQFYNRLAVKEFQKNLNMYSQDTTMHTSAIVFLV